MKLSALQRRSLVLLVLIVPLLLLFVYVALRSGPLAPVAVTVTTAQMREIRPALFGVGTVEARYSYRIGPTAAGRVKRLDVQVGDRVKVGQLLGEMDVVDLDDRIRGQQAAVKRSEAAVLEAEARQRYAARQAQRYKELLDIRATSEETTATKLQELQVADAALTAAREERFRARAELAALQAQQRNLQLVAPVAGLVAQREVEPGTTVVAGQSVVELIDPSTLWVNVRFDQINAAGISAGLPAKIELRSRKGQPLNGRVIRLEPKADLVTEETLAKVVFDQQPDRLPPVGELAEVTVSLPPVSAAVVVPNAAIRRQDNRVGVWRISDGDVQFVPVSLGAADLYGQVQVLVGLAAGEQLVVYSEKALTPRSRIRQVPQIPGTPR
jgi:RND family efflux transporter MFP subunit